MFFLVGGIFMLFSAAAVTVSAFALFGEEPQDERIVCCGGGLYFWTGAGIVCAGWIFWLTEFVLYFVGGFDPLVGYVGGIVCCVFGCLPLSVVFFRVTFRGETIECRRLFFPRKRYRWEEITSAKIRRGVTLLGDRTGIDVLKGYAGKKCCFKINEDYRGYEEAIAFVMRKGIPVDDYGENLARRAREREEKREKKRREKRLSGRTLK